MMRVIEATVMDRGWQVVLDCLDTDRRLKVKGMLLAFRKLLIEAHMDRRLILDSALIPAVGVTPANVPEASVSEDLERQGARLKELHIDRAYLSSHLVPAHSDDLEVYCKAWPVRASKYFHKHTFTLDWQRPIICCPAQQEMPIVPGGVVHFPKEICAQCPLKAQCTSSTKGRSVRIHPDEALLSELRQRHQSPQRRTQLRQRVAVEQSLAHVGHWQGAHAIVGYAKISSICVAVLSSTSARLGSFPASSA